MSILPGSSHSRRRDLKDLSAQGQAAAEWFRKLANALKTSRLYLPDNVIVKQVREELVNDLIQHLGYFGNWRLFFSTDHIHLENEAVVRPSPVDPDLGVPLVRSPEEVLPYLFYRDGIRTLILKKGLRPREIDVLFDALRIVGASAAGNDDLVTLLWQANLRDIQIESVPLEQAIYLSAKAVRKKSAGGATKGLAFAWAPSGGEIRAELGQGAGSQGLHRDTFDDWPLPEVHAQAVNAYRTLLPVIGPLRAGMLAEWEAESTRDWTEDAPDVLRQILALDPREETRRGLAHSVVTWLLNAVRTCAWAQASRALALLHEFDPDLARAGEELDEGLADLPEDEIYGRLDESEPAEHAAFSALIVALGERAHALAFGVLATCMRVRARAAAAAALSYVYADEPKKLAPQLESPHWYVVRNVVFVLGQIGGSGVVDMLRTAALHHEPRVKRAVVQAVGGVSRAERTPILMSLLDTRDSQLLAAVLNMLTREKNSRVTRALFDRVAVPEFADLSEVNQRALWNALLEVADDELVAPLEQLLTHGPWLTRPSLAGIGAARTLRRIGTDRAIEALETGLRSRNEAVSAACLDALSSKSTL